MQARADGAAVPSGVASGNRRRRIQQFLIGELPGCRERGRYFRRRGSSVPARPPETTVLNPPGKGRTVWAIWQPFPGLFMNPL